jgi:hypothetical protein
MAESPPEQHGEEFSEFLFGPNPRDDGSVPGGDEEKRRQEAVRYHAAQLAKKHGIELTSESVYPAAPTAATPRAANIAEIAREVMPEANEKAKTRIAHGKIELPDGTKISKTIFELGCLDDLGKAIKNMASPFTLLDSLGKLAKRVLQIGIRIGPFRGSVEFNKDPEVNAPVE